MHWHIGCKIDGPRGTASLALIIQLVWGRYQKEKKREGAKKASSGVRVNPHPDGPQDFPPPDGRGLLRAPSNSAPGPRNDTR